MANRFAFSAAGLVAAIRTRRLLEPIGNIPPDEAEDRYYASLELPAQAV